MWQDQTLEVGNKTYEIGTGRNEPQQGGTALTYYRRQSLAAAGGIATEDDDAQSFQAPKPRQVQQRQQQPQRQERPGPAWDTNGPPCPKCSKPTNVDINYRAWFKVQENLPDNIKNRAGLWCKDWRPDQCGFKAWTTDEAQTVIAEANGATFDDGLNATGVV